MSDYPLAVVVPLSILSVAVVAANIGVCLLVYKVKSMRTYTNGFVVSLAISDIMTGITLFIQYNVELHSQSKVALNIIYALVLFCGVSNLCAVTFDRYLAVIKPFKYQEIIHRFFKVIVPVIWLMSLVVSLLPAVAWNGNIHVLANKVYIFLTLILGAVLPFIFIMYSHLRIYSTVRSCIKKERQLSLSSTQSNHARESRRQARKLSSEAKVAKVFAIAAIMFILSWFPVLIYTGAAAVDKMEAVPSELFTISPFTLTLGSIVNPILYSFMKPDFRRALRKIWIRRFSQNRAASFRSHRSSNVPSLGDFEPNGHTTNCNNNDADTLLKRNNSFAVSNGTTRTSVVLGPYTSIESAV